MTTRREQRKIWSGIMDLLLSARPMRHPSVHKSGRVRRIASSRNAERQDAEAPRNRNHFVVVLDRSERDVIVVSWRDPQQCCYAEQIWRLRRAPRSGTCALTGCTIAMGTSVFMPSSRLRSANADEMILSSVLSPEGELLNDTTAEAIAVHDDDT